jgi:hypothetical protein
MGWAAAYGEEGTRVFFLNWGRAVLTERGIFSLVSHAFSVLGVLALMTVIVWIVRCRSDGPGLLDLPSSVPFYISIDIDKDILYVFFYKNCKR